MADWKIEALQKKIHYVRNAYNGIASGLSWSERPEGLTYWMDIYNKLNEIEADMMEKLHLLIEQEAANEEDPRNV